jgi:bloom syndrome protein
LSSQQPSCKLLYTTPEAIVNNDELCQSLKKLHQRHLLARIIIDEAHCVSNWGHEFRPAYLDLKRLKILYKGIQIASFTATATPKVQMDIVIQLGLGKVHMHRQSFVRGNLSYKVLPKVSKVVVNHMSNLIKGEYSGQSGIIYCFTRKNCESVATKLCSLGVSAAYFHAGLNTAIKNDIQDRWINNRIQVIVATIAFGLGINKPDVRFVFHHCMPKSIEGYYQETGRAGRDGLLSDCILFYSKSDKNKLEHMIKSQRGEIGSCVEHNLELLSNMDDFCSNDIDCRKKQLSVYLGEYKDIKCSGTTGRTGTTGSIGVCDNCKNIRRTLLYNDLTPYIRNILSIMESQPTIQHNLFMDQMYHTLPLTKSEVNRLVNQLIINGHLKHVVTIVAHQIVEYYQMDNTHPIDRLSMAMGPEINIAKYFGVK